MLTNFIVKMDNELEQYIIAKKKESKSAFWWRKSSMHVIKNDDDERQCFIIRRTYQSLGSRVDYGFQ